MTFFGARFFIDSVPVSSQPGVLAKRRLNKAIALFKKVIEMNPENWGAMFGMAKAFHRLGDKARAFDLMLQAHNGDPSLSGFAREVGLVAFQLKRFREGIQLTRTAIGTRSGDGSLYSNLGLGYLLDGDADSAVTAFEQAHALEPNHSLTSRLLAMARAVRSGSLPVPTSEADVLQAAQQIGREPR